MKQKILKFFRKKSVRRGVRGAVCLLLALMMTASDALRLVPPGDAAAAETTNVGATNGGTPSIGTPDAGTTDDVTTNAAIEDNTEMPAAKVTWTDRVLYDWTECHSYRDLEKRKGEWVPVLITWHDGGNEYILSGNKNFDSSYYLKGAGWNGMMNNQGYPSLNVNKVKKTDWKNHAFLDHFWTLDDSVSNLAVWNLNKMDEEWGKMDTYLIGRNITWPEVGKEPTEKDAGQLLVYKGVGRAGFDVVDGTFYKEAKKAYPDTFRSWSIFDYDEALIKCGWGDGLSTQPFDWMEDSDGQTHVWRVNSFVNNGNNADLSHSGDLVYSTWHAFYSNSETNFHLWTGVRKTIPTVTRKGKVQMTGCMGLMGEQTLNKSLSEVVPDAVVETGTLLNIDHDVLIEDGAVLLIQPGGVMTVDGNLYNNGTIINYGTIFVKGGGSIRPLGAATNSGGFEDIGTNYGGDYGRLICSGSTDNGKTFTGEGNLVVFKDGLVAFDDRGGNFFVVKDGASVELNGTIFCPGFFTLAGSDFHIRESGNLISQYKSTYRFADKELYTGARTFKQYSVQKVSLDADWGTSIPYYYTGDCNFINEGTFKRQTEPSATLPKTTKNVWTS